MITLHRTTAPASARTRIADWKRLSCQFFSIVVTGVGLLLTGAAHAQSSTSTELIETPADVDRWEAIRPLYFGDAEIVPGEAIIELEAPKRAHDAALVPVTIRALDSAARSIVSLHLIVDKNPLPLAAIFNFEEEANGWSELETRIRINEYTDVRAVAELKDGSLHMVSRFVKASGGCSAPAMADMQVALNNAGRMKLLVDQIGADVVGDAQSSPVAEAVIKINHPNNSGMQFDQVSRNYIPPFFVHTIGASVNGKPLMSVETNFSLSENPVVRLTYPPSREHDTLAVHVLDSSGKRYESSADFKINFE